MQINSQFFMKLAIDEAWKYQLLTYPNPAVGAVVIKSGEILSIEAHKFSGGPHAEVLALKEAFLKKNSDDNLKILEDSFQIHDYLIKNHNNFFHDCEIFVTLEPCNHIGKTPSCANLIKELNLKKVYIGSYDTNAEASGGKKSLEDADIVCEIGILKEDCDNLLYPFKKWSENNFVFFKMAQTLNGTTDGGYISSKESLTYVHKIRDKLDLLIIGGNSVRIDRPRLDARFCNGKAPDVLIYSKNSLDDFDKKIPLFDVKDRKVCVDSKIDKHLNKNKFVMVEGVYNLMDKLFHKIDLILLIISPKIRNGQNLNNYYDEKVFTLIYFTKINEDIIFWLKRL